MQITHCDYPKCDFKSTIPIPAGQKGTSKITVSMGIGYHNTMHFDVCPNHLEAIGVDTSNRAQDTGAELLERLAEFVQDEIYNSSE